MGFVQTAIAAGLVSLVQEDLACIGAGVAVAEGYWSLAPVIVGCGVGTMLTDLLWILIGRVCGPSVLRRRPIRWWVKDHHIASGRLWIAPRVGTLIFLGRFLPGFRTPLHLALGLSSVPVRAMLPYIGVFAFVYVGLLAALATALGTTAGRYAWWSKAPPAVSLFLVAVALWLGVRGLQRWVGPRVWSLFQRREAGAETG